MFSTNSIYKSQFSIKNQKFFFFYPTKFKENNNSLFLSVKLKTNKIASKKMLCSSHLTLVNKMYELTQQQSITLNQILILVQQKTIYLVIVGSFLLIYRTLLLDKGGKYEKLKTYCGVFISDQLLKTPPKKIQISRDFFIPSHFIKFDYFYEPDKAKNFYFGRKKLDEFLLYSGNFCNSLGINGIIFTIIFWCIGQILDLFKNLWIEWVSKKTILVIFLNNNFLCFFKNNYFNDLILLLSYGIIVYLIIKINSKLINGYSYILTFIILFIENIFEKFQKYLNQLFKSRKVAWKTDSIK